MASAGQAESTPATRSVPVARAEGRPRPLLEARARTLDVRIDGFVVKQNGRHRTVLYTIASRAPREEKVCTVSRRYTEFVALYNRLQLLGEPGMPLLPPKHMFGPSFSNTHLAFRVGKLQHFVRWVAGKPDMLKMVEVQSFFGRVHDLAAACAHELEEHGPPLVALASGTPVTGDDDDDWLDGTLVAVLDGKDELLRLDLEEISKSSASEGHTSSECICKLDKGTVERNAVTLRVHVDWQIHGLARRVSQPVRVDSGRHIAPYRADLASRPPTSRVATTVQFIATFLAGVAVARRAMLHETATLSFDAMLCWLAQLNLSPWDYIVRQPLCAVAVLSIAVGVAHVAVSKGTLSSHCCCKMPFGAPTDVRFPHWHKMSLRIPPRQESGSA